MLLLGFLAVLVAAGAGLAVKYFLDRSGSMQEITWKEFVISLLVIALVVTPIVLKVGWDAAKENQLTFHENWNGWELEAIQQEIFCYKDGPCWHDYSCEPYQQIHYYETCDDDGCTTHYYYTTEYHSCPYTEVETTYVVKTTLGDYTIAQHQLPSNPEAHRWTDTYDYDSRIPSYVLDQAGVGIPPFWAAAQERIAIGEPGPVTARMDYENYILASGHTILRQYSGAIERYLADGLLPDVQSTVYDWYLAEKVYFVGYTPADQEAWQCALGYLNGALGTELQGDLHLVIADADLIQDPDEYILALKAHWQNPEVFGRDALSKNAVVVVVGTEDGQNVAWMRATTGMPIGNESLIVAVRAVKDIPLVPETLVGDVTGDFYQKSKDDGTTKLAVRGLHGEGVLERLLWGMDDESTRYTRVSMTSNDLEDVGLGFTYLYNEIEPTTSQKAWILFFTFLGSAGIWYAAAEIGERTWRGR